MPHQGRSSLVRPSHVSRLVDDLAEARMLYPSPLITAPSVLVIDIPAGHRGGGLCLGRYYPIIIETEAERDELEGFLAAPRVSPVPPDLLDHRPSNLWSPTILISRYEPPQAGWPWLSIVRWPDSFTEAARSRDLPMARGCYTMDMFEQAHEVDQHHMAMLDSLTAQFPIDVRALSAERVAPGGTA
jgi:hypothetical protein